MAFGDIVKVTPSSKVVGDMALFLVSHGTTIRQLERLGASHTLTLPNSVVEMFSGALGEPDGGWPQKMLDVVLRGQRPKPGRPGEHLAPVDLEETSASLREKTGHDVSRTDLLSYLMYPQVFLNFDQKRQLYGDVSVLPTPQFYYGMEPGEEILVELEPGKTLIIKFLTVGEPHPDGKRTVFFELNGQPREVSVQDESLKAETVERAKADPANPGHVGAPIPGAVTSIMVETGRKCFQRRSAARYRSHENADHGLRADRRQARRETGSSWRNGGYKGSARGDRSDDMRKSGERADVQSRLWPR